MMFIDMFNFLHMIPGFFIREETVRGILNKISLFARREKKHIIAVFDHSTLGIRLQKKRYQNITIIVAHDTADNFIIHKVAEERDKKIVIVTNDRGIKNNSQKKNITTLSSQKFWYSINEDRGEKHYHDDGENNDIKKTTEYQDDTLDELMKKYTK